MIAEQNTVLINAIKNNLEQKQLRKQADPTAY